MKKQIKIEIISEENSNIPMFLKKFNITKE